MNAKADGTHAQAVARPERQRLLLGLLRERLDEAEGAGELVLKLEPEDMERLCSEAGIEANPVATFRSLVRANLVRLRGRWREGISGAQAPVYVERLTEQGLRLLAGFE